MEMRWCATLNFTAVDFQGLYSAFGAGPNTCPLDG